MKMTMTEAEALGRIKMGVNVDIKRSDGKIILYKFHILIPPHGIVSLNSNLLMYCNVYLHLEVRREPPKKWSMENKIDWMQWKTNAF